MRGKKKHESDMTCESTTGITCTTRKTPGYLKRGSDRKVCVGVFIELLSACTVAQEDVARRHNSSKKSTTKRCMLTHRRGVRVQTVVHPRSRAHMTRRLNLDTHANGGKGRHVRNSKKHVFRCSRVTKHTGKHAGVYVHERACACILGRCKSTVALATRNVSLSTKEDNKSPSNDGVRGTAQEQRREHASPWQTPKRKHKTVH